MGTLHVGHGVWVLYSTPARGSLADMFAEEGYARDEVARALRPIQTPPGIGELYEASIRQPPGGNAAAQVRPREAPRDAPSDAAPSSEQSPSGEGPSGAQTPEGEVPAGGASDASGASNEF